MTNELTEKTFEDLKRIKEGVECWSARDLMPILRYKDWRNFIKVIMSPTENGSVGWKKI